ncbi:dihydrofolate reductase family protein [Olivibacter sp. CPCC 100613]|uniref:dihydrofolate reductase family protein n=1 Tax=Olivibacter sp. CPCC 100613 TaxID=3079931 RepID=UPI002FFB938B
MKKIIVCNWLSLDGFFSGRNGETDWFFWNDEIEHDQLCMQKDIALMLFGRTTYDIMANYWPTTAALNENKQITRFMNNTPKIVFSSSLKEINWRNSIVKKELKHDEMYHLKQNISGDILIFGSGSIASQLMNLDLVDELRFLITPIVLGSGQTMFQHVHGRVVWQQCKSKSFNNGVTLTVYGKQPTTQNECDQFFSKINISYYGN